MSSTYTTGHVGINVTDLDRSARFYQDVFGWEVQTRGDDPGQRFVFLGGDDQLILTLWEQASGAFATDRPGLHHLSFQVDDIDLVRQTEARLQEAGGQPLHGGIVSHGEGESSGGIFFTDPDGTRLEVYAPAGADDQPAPSGHAPTCGFF